MFGEGWRLYSLLLECVIDYLIETNCQHPFSEHTTTRALPHTKPHLFVKMVTSVYLPVVSTFSKDANPCQGLSSTRAKIFHRQKFKASLLIFQNSKYHPQCLISAAGQSKYRTQMLFWVCLFFFSIWEFEHFKAQDKCCQYLLLNVITLRRNSRGGDCARRAGGNLTGLNIRKSNRNPHFMHEWHHRVHLSHSLATNIYSGIENKFSLD